MKKRPSRRRHPAQPRRLLRPVPSPARPSPDDIGPLGPESTVEQVEEFYAATSLFLEKAPPRDTWDGEFLRFTGIDSSPVFACLTRGDDGAILLAVFKSEATAAAALERNDDNHRPDLILLYQATNAVEPDIVEAVRRSGWNSPRNDFFPVLWHLGPVPGLHAPGKAEFNLINLILGIILHLPFQPGEGMKCVMRSQGGMVVEVMFPWDPDAEPQCQ